MTAHDTEAQDRGRSSTAPTVICNSMLRLSSVREDSKASHPSVRSSKPVSSCPSTCTSNPAMWLRSMMDQQNGPGATAVPQIQAFPYSSSCSESLYDFWTMSLPQQQRGGWVPLQVGAAPWVIVISQPHCGSGHL